MLDGVRGELEVTRGLVCGWSCSSLRTSHILNCGVIRVHVREECE